jgi:hypothetical protein
MSNLEQAVRPILTALIWGRAVMITPSAKQTLTTSDEGGNLVFEIVCHYPVTQTDAIPSCTSFTDHLIIPAVGSHVAITGTLVTETNHAKWNEIHPVSSIKIQ